MKQITLGRQCDVRYRLVCSECDIQYFTPLRKELEFEHGLIMKSKCGQCNKRLTSDKRIIVKRYD